MQSINSTQGQWLGDVAVEHSGTIEALFDLAVSNNISPSEYLQAGTELRPSEMQDKRIMNYYKRNGIKPASSDVGENGLARYGIGVMTINIDFVVR